MNYTIFDLMYPKYKIKKPIRLIEFFAGYGSQALALKYLGVPFEHYKICEWAIKSIQAYRDIHFSDKKYNTQNNPSTKEFVVDYLYNLGISSNYNEPMTKQQIERLSFEKLDKIYQNIIVTNNLVNIQQVKGSDLEIVDTDKFDYILTYSFPCQDLSLAGKGKGMSDTSTRSGMLWEVERILSECNELGELPQILLMENVPQVHSQENIKDFNKWYLRLEELGYKNYMKDLVATDYNMPQIRNRCYMISILGNYSYNFPESVPLNLKLNDLLENNISEDLYLSNKAQAELVIDTIKDSENSYLLIKNATKLGYLRADPGDCIDLAHPKSKTHRGRVQKDKIHTLTTQNSLGIVTNDLRIRKLTAKESFRFMGVKDEDFEKVSKNQSNISLYHLAGDSIVVNVLMAIFKELF